MLHQGNAAGCLHWDAAAATLGLNQSGRGNRALAKPGHLNMIERSLRAAIVTKYVSFLSCSYLPRPLNPQSWQLQCQSSSQLLVHGSLARHSHDPDKQLEVGDVIAVVIHALRILVQQLLEDGGLRRRAFHKDFFLNWEIGI